MRFVGSWKGNFITVMDVDTWGITVQSKQHTANEMLVDNEILGLRKDGTISKEDFLADILTHSLLDADNMMKYTLSIMEFGFPLRIDTFNPVITLAKYDNASNLNVKKLMSWLDLNFKESKSYSEMVNRPITFITKANSYDLSILKKCSYKLDSTNKVDRIIV